MAKYHKQGVLTSCGPSDGRQLEPFLLPHQTFPLLPAFSQGVSSMARWNRRLLGAGQDLGTVRGMSREGERTPGQVESAITARKTGRSAGEAEIASRFP